MDLFIPKKSLKYSYKPWIYEHLETYFFKTYFLEKTIQMEKWGQHSEESKRHNSNYLLNFMRKCYIKNLVFVSVFPRKLHLTSWEGDSH